MKKIIERWDGQFKIGSKVTDNLDDWNPANGDQFSMTLIPKRRQYELENHSSDSNNDD